MRSRLNLRRCSPNFFGDVMILVFFLTQVLDGAFTYVGVTIWGPEIEVNPIMSWVIANVGLTVGLGGAKLLCMAVGAFLHLTGAHRAVAVAVIVYVVFAIVPWTAIFIIGRPY